MVADATRRQLPRSLRRACLSGHVSHHANAHVYYALRSSVSGIGVMRRSDAWAANAKAPWPTGDVTSTRHSLTVLLGESRRRSSMVLSPAQAMLASRSSFRLLILSFCESSPGGVDVGRSRRHQRGRVEGWPIDDAKPRAQLVRGPSTDHVCTHVLRPRLGCTQRGPQPSVRSRTPDTTTPSRA